jgi:signal transduction histidine kinase/DNA-binding response OmpR family regulator/ligand-binding sensor domain-containing protein
MRFGIRFFWDPLRSFAFAGIIVLLFSLPFLVTQELHGQKTGFKYLNNFTPNDYNGQDQNWSILQDRRGIIYVGNQAGLLQYDGVSWRLIPIPNNVVHSMVIDEFETIFIGGESEIGFITPDSKGALQYHSLLEYLRERQKNFSSVRNTHATKEGVYFCSKKYLFLWNPRNQKIREWIPEEDFFLGSYTCGEKLFLHLGKNGLMQMVNHAIVPVPGGEIFAKKEIAAIIPYDSQTLLICTRLNGLYTFNGTRMKSFPTVKNKYLREKELIHGIPLVYSPGEFALATLQGGLVIIDSKGKLKEIFNKDYGLQDNDVKVVFEDAQGNLWLGLNSGISKIDYQSPFSLYDDRARLPGRVLSVERHQGRLYAGTNSGLYSFSDEGHFTAVLGIPGMCWSLVSTTDSLLAATTTYGVYQLGNEKGTEKRIKIIAKIIEEPSYVLQQSQILANRVWVGTAKGLISLSSKNEKGKRHWQIEPEFHNITDEIRTIAEDKNKNLWLGTLTKGVITFNLSENGTNNFPAVNHYYTSNGLPSGKINVYQALGHVVFATEKGLYRFDESNKMFIPDDTFGREFANGSRGVFHITEDKNKSVWINSGSQNYQAILEQEQTFVLYKIPFPTSRRDHLNSIYPDPHGNIAWFACDDGLIQYDTTVKKNSHQNFHVLIRKVLFSGKLVYGGNNNSFNSQPRTLYHTSSYKSRNVQFEYAATFLEGEKEIKYQCVLDGQDNRWSAWSLETKKEYVNLDTGSYTFRIRAQNIFGDLSREDAFQFKILPPWYRTWWASLLYVIGFFFLIFFAVKWRSRRLEQEKHRLEQIISERTKEIKVKSQQLEEQSLKLKELNQVKSRFFANISHEFRTPLTLIMSPLEQMLESCRDKTQKKSLTIMYRNSQRLLTLINQLLDLSRFDSGKMELQVSCQNIVPFLKGTVASFQIVARENQLKLMFHSEKDVILLYFDGPKMEEVMYNLLINAIKFTPAGGKISVTVTVDRDQQGQAKKEAEFVYISVKDTGAGISQEHLAHIFDRFYQAEGLRGRDHKGTGIGLALTKEIVLLHQGKIDVHSQEGKETEFVIRLPMGHEHLSPNQIVSSSETATGNGKCKEIESLHLISGSEEDDEKINHDISETEAMNGTETKAYEDNDHKHEKNVILVVEDDNDVREFIRSPLEPFYTVVEAKDGQEGIARAEEIIPDLIVSDIMMPGLDGYELCRRLKKDINTSHIPIILLTAKASEESIIKGLETGADDYITKPFNTKMLLTRIKNLIDLRRQLQLKIQRQKMLLPAEISISSPDEKFLKEFQDIIEKNLANSEFNVDILCKKLYMGRSTLFRKIQALTGETPHQFILSYRLERGAQLLREKYGNVTEVAMALGFSSPQYFARRFKEKFNQSPSSFLASESKPL